MNLTNHGNQIGAQRYKACNQVDHLANRTAVHRRKSKNAMGVHRQSLANLQAQCGVSAVTFCLLHHAIKHIPGHGYGIEIFGDRFQPKFTGPQPRINTKAGDHIENLSDVEPR